MRPSLNACLITLGILTTHTAATQNASAQSLPIQDTPNPNPNSNPIDAQTAENLSDIFGSLDTDDPTLGNTGRYTDTHPLRVSANVTYTIDLQSDDFDTVLLVTDEKGNTLAQNDDAPAEDGGDPTTTNSQVVFTSNGNRTVNVIVSSYGDGETGDYRLSFDMDVDVTFTADHAVAFAANGIAQGTLTDQDPQTNDTSRYDVHTFNAQPDTVYLTWMNADGFAPYLFVYNQAMDEQLDRGERLLVWSVDQQAPVHIVANSLHGNQTGTYTLHNIVAPRITLATDTPGELADGDVVFSDNTLCDVMLFEAQPGRSYTVTLTADQHDAYLIVRDFEGNTLGENDDDETGQLGTGSRVTFQANDALPVLIYANAYSPDGRGPYTLRVED